MENPKNNQHGANQEVLSAIKVLADKTDKRFDEVFEVVTFIKDNAVTKEEFNREITGIKGEISGIKGEIGEINGRLTRVEATMITKDYLDEKMMDSRGDLVVMMRKEDSKLKTLVGVLAEKKVINNSDVKRIYALEPFAQ